MFDKLRHIFSEIIDISKMIDLYKKETVIQSLPALTYVNRAKKLIEKNDFISSEVLLKEALSLPQKDPLVYKYLGLIYEKTGKFQESVENYQISAELNPYDKNIWQRLGFSLLSLKEYERAEKSFENADKIQAGNSDTFIGWGMALMKQKKYPESHSKFETAIKINKYNFSAIFLSSVVEIKLNMYDKAENKLAFLVKVCPNESNTFEYARLKALKENVDDAIYYAEKSIEYNPNMLPAYILLGQLYAKKLDFKKSLEYFSKAEERNLKSVEFYFEWGKILEKSEKLDEAEEKLINAYNMNSDNIEICAYLGLSYVNKKDYEKAQPLLQKVLANNPEHKIAKQALGIIAYENGDIDKAIQILRNEDDSVNYFYLAKCYETKKDYNKTVECYESALRLNDKYITAYTNYINYLISRENYREAQRKLRKVLKFDENNTELLNLMFYVSYILVKDNVYEYNLKETISIADKIGEELFEYPEQKQELEKLLQERDKN